MKIQFFKNKDIILKEKKISDKLKKELRVEDNYKSINYLITSMFILEKDIKDSVLLKIFVIGFKEKCKVYLLDSNHKISIIHVDKTDFNNENLEEFFINIYNSSKIINISPYNLNKDIELSFNMLIKDLRHSIESIATIRNLKAFNLINSIYKSDIKNVVNYIQNICFRNIDKDLFKECYPYSLHSKKIKKNCLYNLLSDNEVLKNNFLSFKRKHSFLSMMFIDKSPTILKLSFNNYKEERLLHKLKNTLKKDFDFITDAQFDYLKGKSYNHFLYIKTPEKYFTYINKAELTDQEYLSLKQLKFLNKVYHKNRTYIYPEQIRKIILDESLIKKITEILSYRENLGSEINCKIENIENFIKDNESSLERNRESFINNILKAHENIKSKDLILDDFMGKKIKINLINIETLKNDFNLLNENKKTYYTNSKDMHSYFYSMSNIYSNDYHYTFILKEGRQKHIFIVKFSFSNSSFESIINYTPRLKKITDSVLKTEEFKYYFFENYIY